MFYLIHFTKIALRFPFKTLSWALLSLSYLILAANPYLPLNLVEQNQKQDDEPTYFHALIDGQQNHSRLSRNLMELPQVTKVDLLNQEEIVDQVNLALSGIKHDIPEGLLTLDYNGLKVYFADDVKESSQVLVRDYLMRLGGASNITLGPIVKKELKTTEQDLWWSWANYGLLSLLFCLWAFITYTFAKLIHRECYLIQEFQRRNFVAVKVYSIASVFIILIAIMTIIQLGNFNLVLIAAAGLFLAPLAQIKRRYQW
jgi:hypothetical protein